MKSFLGFVRKEFYHIFRDPRTRIILFGIPVAQILLFGYVLTNEIKDAGIAILDQSKDEVTKKISNKILSSGYFLLEKNLESYSQIEEEFRKGKIKMVIVFEPGFGKKIEKEGQAPGGPGKVNTGRTMIQNFISVGPRDRILRGKDRWNGFLPCAPLG